MDGEQLGDVTIQVGPGACPLSTAQLVDLCMAFVEAFNEAAEVVLYAYQRVFLRRIIEALLLRDGSTITGLWSRQSGKSESLAALSVSISALFPALALSFPDDPRLQPFRRGLKVGIFAPKQKQSTIIYERIRSRAHSRAAAKFFGDPDINIAITASRGDRVAWSNGSFVQSQTASDQSNVEGETYNLIIIDEAQLVSERKVSKELSPMLAATNGVMVQIGTANLFQGGFKAIIRHNIKKHQDGGPRNHFEFPYEVVIKEKRRAYERTRNVFHLEYEKWVTSELEKLGNNPDNREFKMNFRLLWEDVSTTAIEQAAFELGADYELEANVPNHRYRHVAGLDLGKVNDPTVLTIVRVEDRKVTDKRAVLRGESPPEYLMKTIVGWYETSGKWEEQITYLLAQIAQWNIEVMVVDATGAGDPIAERLATLLPSIVVVPFRITLQGNHLLYSNYIQEFEAKRVRYCSGEKTTETFYFKKFVREHLQLQKFQAGDMIRCMGPDSDHDDYCDSAALAIHATAFVDASEVEEEAMSVYPTHERGSTRADKYRTARR
jgi:hypothetical protein